MSDQTETDEAFDADLAQRFAAPAAFDTELTSTEAMIADMQLIDLADEELTGTVAAVRAAQVLLEFLDARLPSSPDKPPIAKSPPATPTKPALKLVEPTVVSPVAPKDLSFGLIRRHGEIVALRLTSKGRVTEFAVQRDDAGRILALKGPRYDVRMTRDSLGDVQRMSVVPMKSGASQPALALS